MSEQIADPILYPDLQAFVEALQRPEYVPPTYTINNRRAWGFDAPLPAGGVSADVGELHLITITDTSCAGMGGFKIVGQPGLHITPCDAPTLLRERFGRRRLAVRLQPPEQEGGGVSTISAVYGVEPLFTGYETAEQLANWAVAEGTVVAFEPAMEIPGLMAEPMPMVKLQLPPHTADEPPLEVWIPSYRPTPPNRYEDTTPQVGDVIQTRIFPELQDVVLPGEETARLAWPAGRAAFETYLMQPAPERAQLAAQRRAETAALLNTLRDATPPEMAEALSTYLLGRYQTFTVLGNGLETLSRIDMETSELQAIIAAVDDRSLDLTELPAGYLVLAGSLSPLASRLTSVHRLAALQQLSDRLIDADELPFGTSIVAQTAEQVQQIATRIVNQTLSWESHTHQVFEPLLTLLDDSLRSETIDRILKRLDENLLDSNTNDRSWRTVRLGGLIYEIVSCMREHANNAQREHIDRQVCGIIMGESDLSVLLAADRDAVEAGGYQLLRPIITTARYAIDFQLPFQRATDGISDEQYRSWVATARHFVSAMRRVGNGYVLQRLSAEDKEILNRLANMDLRPASN